MHALFQFDLIKILVIMKDLANFETNAIFMPRIMIEIHFKNTTRIKRLVSGFPYRPREIYIPTCKSIIRLLHQPGKR